MHKLISVFAQIERVSDGIGASKSMVARLSAALREATRQRDELMLQHQRVQKKEEVLAVQTAELQAQRASVDSKYDYLLYVTLYTILQRFSKYKPKVITDASDGVPLASLRPCLDASAQSFKNMSLLKEGVFALLNEGDQHAGLNCQHQRSDLLRMGVVAVSTFDTFKRQILIPIYRLVHPLALDSGSMPSGKELHQFLMEKLDPVPDKLIQQMSRFRSRQEAAELARKREQVLHRHAEQASAQASRSKPAGGTASSRRVSGDRTDHI